MPPTRWLPRGWRGAVILNIVFASIVLLINAAVTIWAVNNNPGDWDRRRLFSGSCSKTKTVNIIGHVVINALSTILLSASNYCMQCISAPTREEVDRAHEKGRWLDIGTPSARNLFSINPAKAALWLFLGLSSFPLHLFYNSALFASIRPSEYTTISAVEHFTQPGIPQYKDHYSWESSEPFGRPTRRQQADAVHQKILSGQLERLENAECFAAYAQPFQSSRGDLVLVHEGAPGSLELGDVGTVLNAVYRTEHAGCHISQPFYFLCDDFNEARCDPPCEELLAGAPWRSNASEWVVWKRRVKYCLSEKAPDVCDIYFNTTIAVLVVCINLAKVVAFTLLLVVIRKQPLLTIGDAVASFLKRPDETTKGHGLVSKTDFKKRAMFVKVYRDSKERWIAAVGRARTFWAVALYVFLFMACWILFGVGLQSLRGAKDIASLFQIGIGTADSRTIINFAEIETNASVPVIVAILIANSPQPIISAAYFLYNAQFTAMAMASEWDTFARKRKGLRVSSAPVGSQRTSHLLQLPYRFAVPLMVLSGLLHWAASQSIFLVDIEHPTLPPSEFAPDPKPTYTTTCGFSPVATLAFNMMGVIMISFLLGLSSRRLKTGMPVAGNCSAAISAACHLPDEIATSDVAEKPLQWGEVQISVEEKGDIHPGGQLRSRRCAFSPEEVTAPVPGVAYT